MENNYKTKDYVRADLTRAEFLKHMIGYFKTSRLVKSDTGTLYEIDFKAKKLVEVSEYEFGKKVAWY